MISLVAFLHGLFTTRTALAVENAVLRHQIAVLQCSVKRPVFHRRDRLLWMLVSKWWGRWRESLVIVQPATVVGWHRAGFRLFWQLKSRGG